MNDLSRSWLKVLSGIFINVASAFFLAPFIGTAVVLPTDLFRLAILTVDIIIGIFFMLIAVYIEGRIEK